MFFRRLVVTRLAGLAALSLLAGVSGAWPAHADPEWMTEDAMRGAFIGKTLDGHYTNGLEWTETYDPNGRLDYRERVRASGGYWYFRGRVFCTFYDPGHGFSGGCFTARQESANCYEFYFAGLSEHDADRAPLQGPFSWWVARASRRGEPSTCERPTA
jgi:hypothetical protein